MISARAPLVVVCLVATMLLAIGCASGAAEVRGVLVDVQSRDLQTATSITLRDQAGHLHTFRVAPELASDAEQSASHLRQHMAAVDEMVVRYREEPDGPVAVEVRHGQ